MEASSAVRVTSPVPRDVWAQAYASDPRAVVSQSLAWRDAVMADGRYTDASLLYEFESGAQVVLPLARRRGLPPRTGVAASWPGHWGVGGPVCRFGDIGPMEAATVLADVRHRGLLAVEVQLRYSPAQQWLDGAVGFTVRQEGCHVLDLAGGFGHVWQHKFSGTARTAVRKAERAGLTVEVDRSGRLAGVFSDLYDKSIQRWAAGQHEPLWLARLRTSRATAPRMLAAMTGQFGKDCGIWVARSNGTPVAAMIVVRAGEHAKYWRGAMDKELAGKLRANDLLHRLAIEDACDAGCATYDMGHTRPGSSLARFKEKLGAVQHYDYRLRAERLPMQSAALAARGWAKKAIGFRDP